AGGLGGVGTATGFGRGGLGGAGGGGGGAGAGLAGGGAGNVGGFIGLLQQLQQLRNQRDNLDVQLRTLGLLEAQLEAGQIDLIQVDEFRQSIETLRAELLASENAMRNTIRNFTMSTLGLPPDLPVELNDRFIQPFQFIDQRVTVVQNRLADLIDHFGDLPEEPELEALHQFLTEVAEVREQAAGLFPMVKADLEHLDSQSEARQKHMTPEQRGEFLEAQKTLAQGLQELQGRFEGTAESLQKLHDSLTPQTRAKTADGVVELTTGLSALVQELSLVEARARMEAVVLEPVVLPAAEAFAIARANRLDWMNNRGALVDTWRLIQFNADALQSSLNIVASGDMGTVGNNMVKFRGEEGSLRLGLQFDAPLTRLLERNNFRQALIDYHQDRRQLIQFEDQVKQTLYQTLEQLGQLERNLDIQRRAMVITLRRVDQTLEELREPPAPVQPGQQPSQLGPTVAQNLLRALSDLRNVQDNFMSVWLVHYATRMTLMRDLGLMQIDENGLWVDVPLEEAVRASEAEAPLPPELPEALLKELNAGGEAGAQAKSPPDAKDRVNAAEVIQVGMKAEDGGDRSAKSRPAAKSRERKHRHGKGNPAEAAQGAPGALPATQGKAAAARHPFSKFTGPPKPRG
ncbi:MAG: hypothetical protein HY000_25880, partial [Planctomycetes bacterium]|nr:hypothetical protein [Planctomycetota bacterium]